MDVTTGKPNLHADAWTLLQGCPPAAAAYKRDVALQHHMPGQRQRLQGRGGRICDLVTMAATWKTWPDKARDSALASAGAGAGSLWAEHSRDEREGWLPDHHARHAILTRLGLPTQQRGMYCALAPASGEHRGQPCVAVLDEWGRHAPGVCCRARGRHTRVHHAVRRRLAASLRQAALRADEEANVPDLAVRTPGEHKDARMDIVVVRPGALRTFLVDITTVDSRSALAQSTGLDRRFAAAEQRKAARYGSRVWTLAVELRGGISAVGAELLDLLASEAARIHPDSARPGALARRWRRQLESVLAFEMAELASATVDAHSAPCFS